MKKVQVLLLIMMFSASGVFASGLSIPEQGAAAMGMSAAMTARSEDLSAIFYNPAGLDYVKKFEITIGLTPIRPHHDYAPLPGYSSVIKSVDAEPKTFLPPHIYAAFRASENMVLGLGVYAPFGLGTEWDKVWNGRYTSTFADIQTIHINPTIAYRASDKVSIGAGVSYITSNATLERMFDSGSLLFKSKSIDKNPELSTLIANTNYDSHFALEGKGTGYAFNVGIIMRPVEKYQFGISFRSAYDMDYEGTAKFKHQETAIKTLVAGLVTKQAQDSGMTDDEQIAAIAAAKADTAYMDVQTNGPATQDGSATMKMPWMLNFGMKADLTDVWDFSADIDIVGWSVNDELIIDFKDDKPYPTKTLPKDWVNSYILRAGTSYDFTGSLVGRCGVLYDINPVPDETMDGQLPDSDRYGLSIGGGYKISGIQLDASYMLLNFLDREKDNGIGFEGEDATGDGVVNRFDVPEGYPVGKGFYESRAHLFSVSATYTF